MGNKRKRDRYKLLKYLKIYDQNTETFMGHLVDISNSGMLAVSEDPIPVEVDYDLWIKVLSEKVTLQARCVWCREDPEIESFNAGFHFLELTQETKMKIKTLVEALKQY
jgi:c-di-GMP-binding flagellar brake protein YcgR